jgi:hypothetical protein
MFDTWTHQKKICYHADLFILRLFSDSVSDNEVIIIVAKGGDYVSLELRPLTVPLYKEVIMINTEKNGKQRTVIGSRNRTHIRSVRRCKIT